ncbi:hypothetical protein HY612_03040 [Candidatus Roizmanbacteria bacterium]|nr:hypothetical protein [Candidatus Roizmanbacteria bacterium]
MSTEIDMSGKIEQTQWDTIIALSNDIEYAIVLSKRTKRHLQTLFRNLNTPRMFIYKTFAALISLIFKEVKLKSKVIIDLEYFGHQDLLKTQILEYVNQLKIRVTPIFEFGFVGKNSHSHILAEQVAYKKRKRIRKLL